MGKKGRRARRIGEPPEDETYEHGLHAAQSRYRQDKLLKGARPDGRPDAREYKVDMVEEFATTGDVHQWGSADKLLHEAHEEYVEEVIGTREDVPHAIDIEDDIPQHIIATAVPEIRQQMVDDSKGLINQLYGQALAPELKWVAENPDYSEKSLSWLQDNLEESTLYWVSPEMCDLLQARGGHAAAEHDAHARPGAGELRADRVRQADEGSRRPS